MLLPVGNSSLVTTEGLSNAGVVTRSHNEGKHSTLSPRMHTWLMYIFRYIEIRSSVQSSVPRHNG